MKQDKAFKLFKKSFNKYAKQFGLIDWTFVFEYKDLGKSEAKTYISAFDHQATVALHTKIDSYFDREMTPNEYIDWLARHEAIHILLGDLGALAHNRYTQEDEIVACEEALTRRLDNLLK